MDTTQILTGWMIDDTAGGFGAFCGVLIGLILGSFAGMASWRWPHEQSWLPPSRCTACGHRLTASELVPVFSWLWQRGRSACCHTLLSGRYAAIEALCGLLTGVVGWHFGLSLLALLLALLICTLAIISTIDLETGLIPDGANLTVGLLGLGFAYLQHSAPLDLAISFAETAGIGIALAGGYSKLRGKDMMGWGDVKFMAAAAPWLAPQPAAFFLALAGALGVFFGLVWKKMGREAEFPFGPSLAVALLALIYWQVL